MVWGTILGVILLVVIVAVGLFNSLSKLKVVVDEAIADIETFLKQRHDMIPNLVEIVKGYAAHEKDTFKEVTEMRTKAMSAGSFSEKAKIEDQLSAGISKIFAVAEAYPELKANTNYSVIQQSLYLL